MKRKIYMIVAVLTLLGNIVLYQYITSMNEIKQVTQDLLLYIDSGNISPNQHFLANSETSNTAKVVDFLRTEKLLFKEKTAIKLTGLKSASQNLRFELKDKDLSFRVNFEKVSGAWKISGFPELEVYPQVLITNKDTAKNKVDFLYAGTPKQLTAPASSSLTPQQVYFLVTLQGRIIFEKPLEKKLVTVISLNQQELETEQFGKLPLSNAVHYYDLTEATPIYGEEKRPIVGQKNVTLYSNNKKVVMVTIANKEQPKNIRVALNSGEFEGLEHKEIRLFSSSGIQVEDKVAKKTYSFKPGEKLNFAPKGDKLQLTSTSGRTINFSNRILLTSKGNNGISAPSLIRGQGTPVYFGQLEIVNLENKLYLVNELPLEKYLYSVVASEMPASFGLEALKIQAIAARSYALNGMFDRKYEHLGAHLEDSVLSQVFNNTKEIAIVNQAVNATKGLALYYEDKAIDAKFFSTSSGITASYHEVWERPNSIIFPGQPVPYLKAKSQLPSKPDFSLITEEQFSTFYASSNNLAFDRESPWFRWEIEMTGDQLRASIENNLAVRYKADPKFILTKTETGYKSEPIATEPIGTLKDIIIVSRGAGGNITELRLEGSNGTYSIKKELNIRYVLSPKNFVAGGQDIELKRWDGSVITNYALLPSSFFSMYLYSDMEPKALTKVRFYGGGNGHGVGMSQWGVKGMLAQRYSMGQILAHFYPGTNLVNIYE